MEVFKVVLCTFCSQIVFSDLANYYIFTSFKPKGKLWNLKLNKKDAGLVDCGVHCVRHRSCKGFRLSTGSCLLYSRVHRTPRPDQGIYKGKMLVMTAETHVNMCTSPPPPPVNGSTIIVETVTPGHMTATYSCKKSHVRIRGSHLVSTCAGGIWSEVDLECTDYSTCYGIVGGRGVYSGKVNVTVSGRSCQRWSSQNPQSHNMKQYDFQNTTGLAPETMTAVTNYCRDPDSEKKPWCYTMDPEKRWEFCSIPKCKCFYASSYMTAVINNCQDPNVTQSNLRRDIS